MMWRAIRIVLACLVIVGLITLFFTLIPKTIRYYPNPSNDFETRREVEDKKLKDIGVFHNFSFTDKRLQSNIDFPMSITDDGGKFAKAVHYDHGTGIAAADVDNNDLIDVYFVNQLGCNKLYKNIGGGKFKDISKSAGVASCDKIHISASFADINNDGLEDLYVTTVRNGNVMYQNLGGGKFKDISKESGLDYVGHSSSALFFDYDNDGFSDLLLVNVGKYTTDKKGKGGYYIGYKDAFFGHLKPERHENIVLYRNLGNLTFENATEETKLNDIQSWSGEADFADLNEDGFADFYLLNMQGQNHYFESFEGKYFVDKTADYFPKNPWGAMGIKFFDYNNDGKLDLYITDMHSDMSRAQSLEEENKKSKLSNKTKQEFGISHHNMNGGDTSIFGNAFYENRGNGKFVEVSDELNLENYWPWGVSASDFNADGFEDLFVTAGMGFSFRYAVNKLYLNDSGREFFDLESTLGIEPRANKEFEKPWFVLDCKGEDKSHFQCNNRSGKHTFYGTLSSRSSVVFDIDNDGDEDILINEWYSQPQIFVNNLTTAKKINFIKIKLAGTQSNKNGLGTKVKVFTKNKTITKYYDGKSGYLSQSQIPLYFGLGNDSEIDKIEVDWVSGKKQIIEKPTINKLLTIKEE